MKNIKNFITAIGMLTTLLGPTSTALADSNQQLPDQSPSLAKCQSAGDEARQNPSPCQSGDYPCAMRIQQQADMMLRDCQQAIEELSPFPLTVTTLPQ